MALLLVGDGARMATVRCAVARHGLGGSVVTTGLVPQNDGPAHLACFDIAVAPTVSNPDGSPFFGSPTKLFEYLAMGRPVVASAIGQVTEIVTDGKFGLLVPAGDVDALVEALARLADDPALRARLGEAARAEAVRRHGHEARVAGLLQAFEQVFELPREQTGPACGKYLETAPHLLVRDDGRQLAGWTPSPLSGSTEDGGTADE
ncbi:glycosyltransferase involved in cell wall biosynthesis [Bradyrhizobium sp. LB7.2]